MKYTENTVHQVSFTRLYAVVCCVL